MSGRFEHPVRCAPVVLYVQTIEFSPCHNSFPAARQDDSSDGSDPVRIIHERICCKRGYAATTGSLAVQSFDILHEYLEGIHVSACPSRFASARFRDEPS